MLFSNPIVKKALIFAAGAIAGAVGSWVYFSKKYGEELEDLEYRVDKLTKKLDEQPEPTVTVREEVHPTIYEKPELSTYREQIKSYSSEEDGQMRTWRKPYIIHPDDFGTLDDYDTISLMYYIDCKLADDDDNLIENVNDVVGWDSLGHFGEFDADTVYVRNERLRIDYEICRSERAYADIMEARPYLRRDNDYDESD